MIFKPELCDLILAGKKTVTRRPIKPALIYDHETGIERTGNSPCKYYAGSTYALQPGRGKKGIGRILIKDVRGVYLDELSTIEAQREGFPDAPAFYEYWQLLYPNSDVEGVRVWRIEFELVEAA